jgi:flagellar biosynthesis protein FlgN
MHDQTLLELFTQDIDTAQQLLELINGEFSCLQERDLPQLQQYLTNKQPLLALLDQHGTVRSQLLKSLQLSADSKGLQQLAAQSSIGTALLEQADKLNNLLQQCQAANIRNGRLIRSSQASNQSILGILRGQETPNLYDSRGAAARIGHQRPLSQA